MYLDGVELDATASGLHLDDQTILNYDQDQLSTLCFWFTSTFELLIVPPNPVSLHTILIILDQSYAQSNFWDWTVEWTTEAGSIDSVTILMAETTQYGSISFDTLTSITQLRIYGDSLISQEAFCIDTVFGFKANSLYSSIGQIEAFATQAGITTLYGFDDLNGNSLSETTDNIWSQLFSSLDNWWSLGFFDGSILFPFYDTVNLTQYFATTDISQTVLIIGLYWESTNPDSNSYTSIKPYMQNMGCEFDSVDIDGNLVYIESTVLFEEEINNQGLFLSDVGILSSYVTLQANQAYCNDVNTCYFSASNLQFFGYTYFVPDITTPSSTEIFVPTGMLETKTVSTTIEYTYLIGNDPAIINDDFAMSGIFVTFQYSSNNDPQVTLLVSSSSLSFTVSQDSSHTDNIGEDIDVTVQIYDRRRPNYTVELVLTFKYRAACDTTEYQNAGSSYISFQDSTIEYWLTTGEEVQQYTSQDFSCQGHVKTVMEFFIYLDASTSEIVDCCLIPSVNCCELESEYITCQANSNSYCFWNDRDSSNLYFQFDSNAYSSNFDIDFYSYALYSDGTSDDGIHEQYNFPLRYFSIHPQVPCIDESFIDPAELSENIQYQYFSSTTGSSTQWFEGTSLVFDTDYLAMYADSTDDVILSVSFFVDSSELTTRSDLCYGQYTFEMTQVTSSTQATNFYDNTLLVFEDQGQGYGQVTVNPVTDSQYVGITDVQFAINVYFTAIHNLGYLLEPTLQLDFTLTVGYCNPYTSIFQVATTTTVDSVSSTTNTDLIDYTYTYYRQNSTQTMTIVITLDPVCDDQDGIVSLNYVNYSLLPIQIPGSLTFTIDLSQPTSTDSDSTQAVTLIYSHNDHLNSVDFTVYYNGCGLSYISDQDVGPINANVSSTVPEVYQNFTSFSDSVSGTNGNNDGITYCGDRKYTIDALLYPFITVTSTLLADETYSNYFTVQASIQFIGGYTVPMLIQLADHTDVQWTVQIEVNIEETVDSTTVCTFVDGQYFVEDVSFNYFIGTGALIIDLDTYFNFTGPCVPDYTYWLQSDSDSLNYEGVTWDDFPKLAFQLETGQIDPMPTSAEIFFHFLLVSEDKLMFNDIVLSISFFDEIEVEDELIDEDDSSDDDDIELGEDDEFFLLEEWPEDAEPILCLGTSSSKNWVYWFPDLVDKDSHVSFWNAALSKILKFDAKEMSVTIVQTSKAEIRPGFYAGTLTVQNNELKENYWVEFEYDCEQELSEVDLTPPKLIVKEADSNGKIIIEWDQAMKVPSNQLIDQGNRIEVLSQNDRGLQDSDQKINMRLIQGSDAELIDPALIASLTWVLQWINEYQIEFSINFDHPELISAISGQKDTLEVTILDPSLFTSSKDIETSQDLTLTIQLPKMFGKNEIKVDIKSIASAGTASLGVAFVFSFILKAILNQLLGLIDSISLITHMFLLTLMYPVNVQEFFGQIFPLISFDLLPFDFINEQLFAFEEVENDEPMTDQFDAVGYESRLIVLTLGDIYYILFLSPAIIVILYLLKAFLKCFCSPNIRPVKWAIQYLDFQLFGYFWNGSIQFIISGYLIIEVCVCIGLYNLKIGEEYLWQENLCSYTTIFLAIVTFPFPIVIGLILYRNIKCLPLPDLDDHMSLKELRDTYGTIDIEKIQRESYTKSKHKALKEKYGVMIQGHNLRKNGKMVTIGQAVLSLLRKLIFAVAISGFTDAPQFAIMIFTYTTQIHIMLEVYFRPIKDNRTQDISIFNEITIMFIIYHLFLLTDFTDISVKGYIGNSVIYITEANIVINLGLIFIPQLFVLKNYCKKFRMVRAHKRRMKTTLSKEQVLPEPSVTITEVEANPQTLVGQTVTELLYNESIVKDHKRKLIIDNVEQRTVTTQNALTVEEFNTSVEMAEVSQGTRSISNISIRKGRLANQKAIKIISQEGRTAQEMIQRDTEQNQSDLLLVQDPIRGKTALQIGMQNLRRKIIKKRQLIQQQNPELISIEESKEDLEDSNSKQEEQPMDDSLIFESLDASREAAVFAQEVKFNQTFGKKK